MGMAHVVGNELQEAQPAFGVVEASSFVASFQALYLAFLMEKGRVVVEMTAVRMIHGLA